MNGNPNEGLKPPKRVFLLKTAKKRRWIPHSAALSS
jgi:hypothetical protein